MTDNKINLKGILYTILVIVGVVTVYLCLHEFGHYLIDKFYHCTDIGFGLNVYGIFVSAVCPVSSAKNVVTFVYEILSAVFIIGILILFLFKGDNK